MPNKHFVHLDWFRTEFDLAYGFSKDWDVELDIPYDVKTVTARYELPDGTPFDNPQGDLHHRDERLQGFSDLKLLANYRPGGVLMKDDRLHVGIGLSLPVGETEEDPWKLGNQGLKHQHIQFGTGTWDPILGAAAGRRFGEAAFTLSAVTRLVFGENGHGYRAGHRFWAEAMVSRRLVGSWSGRLGLDVAREEPERWGGRVRIEEGNLGRTDLLAIAGVDHRVAGAGSLWLTARVPLVTDSEGAQVDYPVIFTVGWAF